MVTIGTDLKSAWSYLGIPILGPNPLLHLIGLDAMVLSERGEQFLLLHCIIIDIFLYAFSMGTLWAFHLIPH